MRRRSSTDTMATLPTQRRWLATELAMCRVLARTMAVSTVQRQRIKNNDDGAKAIADERAASGYGRAPVLSASTSTVYVPMKRDV